MKLSIIIVSWNTQDFLAQCLVSVAKAREGFALEAIVVDNASTDGSAEMVRERFPWVKLIENTENLGFARANNQAIELSTGQYVLLLNSDAELHPGALEALLGFMDAQPEAGACGPLLLNSDGSLQISCHPMLTPGREAWRLLFLDQLWPRASYPVARWDRQTPRAVDVLKGACLLLRRAALDQVGLLDERYFIYTEEVDLCYRLHEAGWSLHWVPQAEIVHHEAASTRQMAEAMYVQLYRSKLQFYRKFGGEARARLARWLFTLAYLPRWAVASALGQRTRARTLRSLLRELLRPA